MFIHSKKIYCVLWWKKHKKNPLVNGVGEIATNLKNVKFMINENKLS